VFRWTAGLAAGGVLAVGVLPSIGGSAGQAAAKPPTGVPLGGLNLAAYCASMHKTVRLAGPIVGTGASKNWRCSSTPVDMTAACKWTYPGTNAVSFLPDANNAYSWTCYAGGAIDGTQVQCDLVLGARQYDRCTATVGGGKTPPTGAVGFKSASGGVFNVGDSCNLVLTPLFANRASCSVEFLPATSVPFSLITASYGGDAHHPASSGHTHKA
jgi:hypothetical protein